MAAKSTADWAAIQEEWEAGQLDIREIARQHGLKSDAAIHMRAKRHGWPPRPDRSDIVRSVVSKALTNEPVANIRTALTVFDRAIGLLREHRRDIADLRRMMSSSLKRAQAIIDRRAAQGRPMSLKEEAIIMGVLRDAAMILSRLVPLERRAFGFTDQDGPSEFDGLTQEELDAVEHHMKQALGR